MSIWPFTRRRTRSHNELVQWLAVQSAIAAEPQPFWFPVAHDCSYDAAREVLVHVAPAYAGDVADVLEFPVAKGWDADSILVTLAEIEAL